MTDTIIAIRKSTLQPTYESEITDYKFSDGTQISKEGFFLYYYNSSTQYYCKTIYNNIKLLSVDSTHTGKRFFKTYPNNIESDNLINLPTF
jgi:Protein of unknown function (DUF3892)